MGQAQPSRRDSLPGLVHKVPTSAQVVFTAGFTVNAGFRVKEGSGLKRDIHLPVLIGRVSHQTVREFSLGGQEPSERGTGKEG